jgi:hypothetical protein
MARIHVSESRGVQDNVVPGRTWFVLLTRNPVKNEIRGEPRRVSEGAECRHAFDDVRGNESRCCEDHKLGLILHTWSEYGKPFSLR